MKLNSFFDKRLVKNTTKKVISFNNEKRELELQEKIDVLEIELARLKNIEAKNDNLVNSNNVFKNERSDYVKEIDRQNTELGALKLQISNLEPKATAMEDAIKSSKQHQDASNQLKSELEQAKNSRLQQDKNIHMLSKERSEYQIELRNTEKKYELEKKTHTDVHNKYEHLQKEYKNVLGFSEKNSKITIEMENKIRDLEKQLSFLEVDAAGARIKMEQTDKIKDNLQDWINSLEQKSNQESVKASQKTGELYEAEKTIGEMALTIDDLMSEMQHMASLNQRYKKELEKPRYMSMESIARKEGFKIPGIASAKNYNKLHLGNAKPTLLKFK